LAALSRAFNLAIAAKKLTPHARPSFPTITLNNAREGFVSHAEFLALRERLPGHLKDPVAFLYYSGWRVSEMREIEWKHVDPSGKSVRLPPHLSKNNNGRLLPLQHELAAIIQRARDRRRLDQPRIFHHSGCEIGDFRKAWQTACAAVGLGRFVDDKDDEADTASEPETTEQQKKKRGRKKYVGLIVHDLRRSCVRNLVQAGIPEKTAMRLTGHKTRAIFDRYNIVSDEDLAEASQRHQAFLAQQKQESKITSMAAWK
jgi:integrase